MLRSYIVIAWRNLKKNRLYSIINTAGLSVGITCCVLIFLYVQYELSYDGFNKKLERLFRVTIQMHQPQESTFYAATSARFVPAIQSAFPEVEKSARVLQTKRTLSVGDQKFFDTQIMYADSALLEMFTFPLIGGDVSTCLKKPYSLVLTESSAKKFFGTDAALGKTMKLSDTMNVTVTAVIKDIPANSHLNFNCLLSRSTISDYSKNSGGKYPNEDDWFFLDTHSYVLLKENADVKRLEPKVDKFIQEQMAPERKEYGIWMNTYLQPVKDIHLHSFYEAELKSAQNSNISYVYIFGCTALLILLIACCNFINLSTAKSINRSKEIGLRKVIGARRAQLIGQFLGESVIITLIASLISFVLVLVCLPGFRDFTGRLLELKGSMFLIYFVIIITVGLLSGIYPAFLMSSFSPVRALRGHIRHGAGDIFFRKGLVIFQFTIAIALIIGSALILKQLSYIQDKDLGLNRDHILQVELRKADMPKVQTLLKEFERDPNVTGTTVNDFSFKGIPAITMLPEGAQMNELVGHNVISVDENFMKTFGLQLLAGRDFSRDFPSDVKDAFIINEAAVRYFNWGSPQKALGKKIDWAFDKSGKVIGVVKDFNYSSLHEQIRPLIIHIFPPFQKQISLRLSGSGLPATIARLEKTWKSVVNESPFKYTFMDEDFDNLYQAERRMKDVLTAFTVLSVFIACLGLFGLATFSIRQRFKEIGVRRVLGAGISSIVNLLCKDFLKLVLIGVVIAIPIAWFAVYKWLENFAYREEISLYVFAGAGAVALLTAFFTVSAQAVKAALSNPVNSLRTE